MLHRRFFACTVLLLVAVFTSNQADAQSSTLLPAGTLITLETNEELSARDITPGKTVKMTTRTPVVQQGKTLIAIGAEASARILRVHDGSDGKNGDFSIEPVSCLAVDGQTVFLGGNPLVVVSLLPGPRYYLDPSTSLSAYVLADMPIMGSATEAPIAVSEPPVQPQNDIHSDTAAIPEDPQPEILQPANSGKQLIQVAAGTEIPLVLSDECIPANVEVGQIFRLRVKQDVIEHGKLVFHAKAPATGKVKYITDTHLYIVAESVTTVDGQIIAVETDNSVSIEFDPDQAEEILRLDAEIPAMTKMLCTVSLR